MRDDNLPNTRDRLVSAMADALQRRGFHGVGVNDILFEAQAPKGVLYHHFPGGKTELAVAAIGSAVARMQMGLAHLTETRTGLVEILATWFRGAQKQLEQSGFERGCPLATVSLESTSEDLVLREALTSAFGEIRGQLAALLMDAGVAAPRAQQLSALIVSAYEGALIQARVSGNATPMRDTTDMLLALVRSELASKEGST